MNRHQRRAHKAVNGWVPLEPNTLKEKTPEQLEALVAHTKAAFPSYSEAEIRRSLDDARSELGEFWGNDTYQVHVIRWAGHGPKGGDVIQLSIKRRDQRPVRDWRDFQRIKNQLVGPECEAIELYPAESRLVDTANQFHLWCIPDPGYRWPVGYSTRHVSGESGAGAVQRPFDEENADD